MKKALSLLLCFMMLFVVVLPVAAADASDFYITLQINNPI